MTPEFFPLAENCKLTRWNGLMLMKVFSVIVTGHSNQQHRTHPPRMAHEVSAGFPVHISILQ